MGIQAGRFARAVKSRSKKACSPTPEWNICSMTLLLGAASIRSCSSGRLK